jgi:hypothetical protein
MDNDEFSGTPLPPEEPAAENPPDGVYIDYVLQGEHDAKLEILDAAGKVVRHFSSSDKESRGHKPLPVAERWFPELPHLENTPGMHRFVWDLRYGSSGEPGAEPEEDEFSARNARALCRAFIVSGLRWEVTRTRNRCG